MIDFTGNKAPSTGSGIIGKSTGNKGIQESLLVERGGASKGKERERSIREKDLAGSIDGNNIVSSRVIKRGRGGLGERD